MLTIKHDLNCRKVHIINSLRPRQNGRRFPNDIFKCFFLNENAWISIKIPLKFVPKGPVNNIPALFQIMAWRRPGDKPLSETRQHSTQSVGNMPPPSPPHLLPHVLQIMPRNPKYDQFQPKGHHNEENPQSTTKMPGNLKFYPFH